MHKLTIICRQFLNVRGRSRGAGGANPPSPVRWEIRKLYVKQFSNIASIPTKKKLWVSCFKVKYETRLKNLCSSEQHVYINPLSLCSVLHSFTCVFVCYVLSAVHIMLYPSHKPNSSSLFAFKNFLHHLLVTSFLHGAPSFKKNP